MDKQLASRIERGLTDVRNISASVKLKIFKDLEKDLILPTLKLRKNCAIEWAIRNNEVSLQIGPRDWQWNLKTGELVGTGTWLGK